MIIKTFEINRKKFINEKFFLVYGENEGLKTEVINSLKKQFIGKAENYDETQIINSIDLFYEKLFNQSLFEKEKIIIINRCSEKIFDIIEQLIEKKFLILKLY